ncbi:MAG: TetR/AcrR family transcriptional regulator [Arachnia sp.]
MTGDVQENTRDRILRATIELLASEGRQAVSTRAVSAAAGIQPQTIYRQFGDMDGLLAEAASEGFRRYLVSKSARPKRQDPVDDLRDGWDLHIEFGLEHPALYLLMYGDPRRSRESAAAAQTATILRELVEAVARAGRLRIDIETAVAMIQSTGVGVVITLIGATEESQVSADLSARVRESVLDAVTTNVTDPDAAKGDDPAVPASALRAMLPDVQHRLTPGEKLLLDELLTKISLHQG